MDLLLNYGPNFKLWTYFLNYGHTFKLWTYFLIIDLNLKLWTCFLDGLKNQSSELSLPWLSAAGAFFCQIFACFHFVETLFAKKRDF